MHRDLPGKGPGSRLRSARESAGLSRRQAADRLGISVQYLADIESDRRPVSLDKIHAVASAIGCDPHAIDGRLAPIAPQ